jgi:hypothetical protein
MHGNGYEHSNGAQKPELGVGEMEGITFKVEPLKRVGEELATKRFWAYLCVNSSALAL